MAMDGIKFLTANANGLKNQAEQEAIVDNKPIVNPNIPRTPTEASPAVDRAKNSIGTVVLLVLAIAGAIAGVGYFSGERVFSFQKGVIKDD